MALGLYKCMGENQNEEAERRKESPQLVAKPTQSSFGMIFDERSSVREPVERGQATAIIRGN